MTFLPSPPPNTESAKFSGSSEIEKKRSNEFKKLSLGYIHRFCSSATYADLPKTTRCLARLNTLSLRFQRVAPSRKKVRINLALLSTFRNIDFVEIDSVSAKKEQDSLFCSQLFVILTSLKLLALEKVQINLAFYSLIRNFVPQIYQN